MTLSVEEMRNAENGGDETPSNSRGADNVAVVASECKEGEAMEAAFAVATPLDASLDDGIPLAVTEMLYEPLGAEESQSHRPAFISVTVLVNESKKKAAEMGISFEKVDEGLRISNIDSEGLFGDTPLREGDFVLSVNNTSCQDRRVAYVSRLLRRSRGSVTLVVRRVDGDPFIVSTMVTKPTPDSKVGIGLQCIDGSLRVSSIDPSGLFAGGILNVGDRVASIGDMPCSCMDSASAIELIRKEATTVNIVAWTEKEAGVVVGTRNVTLAGSIVDLLILWRRNIMIVSITVTIIAVIAIIVSQTGSKTPCKDLGQRPLPVARECP